MYVHNHMKKHVHYVTHTSSRSSAWANGVMLCHICPLQLHWRLNIAHILTSVAPMYMYIYMYTHDSVPLLQLALDTYYWNPIHHFFVWGSIVAWFVVLPITSSPAFYNPALSIISFNFLGVFYEVFKTATFWFYWPLATVIALAPTIIFRTVRLDLWPTQVDDVRLQMKKEGPKLFRRAMLKKKLPRISFETVKQRTGYAFSHQGGFGRLILSGRMFGGQTEEQVRKERERRISTIIQSAPSSPVPSHREPEATQSTLDIADVTVYTQQASEQEKSVSEQNTFVPESLPMEHESTVAKVSAGTPEELITGSFEQSLPGAVSPTSDQIPAESAAASVTPTDSDT